LKNERGADISPFWRAFLSVFFCYPLFQNIEKEANESGIETKWKPKTLYFIFLSAILLGFISNGAHPMVSAAVLCFQIANPVIVMLPVQETINKLNHDQLERVINKRFSIYNYLAIAVGIIWLATVLIGVFSQ
jgi:hypothetical protein